VTLLAGRAPRDGAGADAADPLARAERDARRVAEESSRATERALAEARARGRREGRAEVEEALARARALADGLAGAHRRALEQASETILEVATEVAVRILGQALSARPETLAQMVASAIERLAGSGDVTVRVHPDDIALLAPQHARLEAAAKGAVRVVADERVDGGCIVESTFGSVDARLSTQLRLLRGTIEDAARAEG
jgi:flagellar assembly protein FliH